VAEVFALLGVVVGSAATFAVSLLGERVRYQRELRMRWDTSKRDAYLEYAVAVSTMARAAGQLAGSHRLDAIAAPEERDRALQNLDLAEINRTAKFESVMLLGDPDCIDAGHVLNRCAWRMEKMARKLELETDKTWLEARNNYIAALDNFHREARESLIIFGAPLISRVTEKPTLQKPSKT
jgi:hypothetical protein